MQHAHSPSDEAIAIFARVLRERYGDDAHAFAMDQLGRFHSGNHPVIGTWLRILERLGTPSPAAQPEDAILPAASIHSIAGRRRRGMPVR